MRNLHVISHTHWDREWYRSFQQFRLKLVGLIDRLLDLLEKDPQFKFFMLDGQTIVLDDYLAMRPEKEAILRQHIKKGRIVIGPWHILPDMFLVGPESHIRNLLQGDRTARKFGPKMMVGYIPDPFGHPGQVPQILRGFGIDTACLWRGPNEQPAEFWWQSPDGSRVLMAYIRDSYSNGASLPADNLPAFAEAISAAGDSLAAHSAVSDYLIMFGTDHMEPPRNTSKAIAYANRTLKGTRVVHSTLPKFVAAIQADIKKNKADLPTVTGELRDCRHSHLLPGVLSTRMWIKQRNHASENLLTKWVEPFSTFASLQVGKLERSNLPTLQPTQRLEQTDEILRVVWRLLMENHPHDSICGCSIDQVHDEMKVRFDQVDQIGEEITRQNLESLAEQIKTDWVADSKTDKRMPTNTKLQDGKNPLSTVNGLSSALVVFNPLAGPRTDVVNATLELPPSIGGFDLLDENGTPIPYQMHGLGGRELINMTLDRKGLQAAFSSISDGRAAGMTIQDIKIRREGEQVFIEAVMSDGGQANLGAWNAGRKQVDAFFADPTVTVYHVRACYGASTQIVAALPNLPGHGYQTLWVRNRPTGKKAPMRLSPLVRALMPLARLSFVQKLALRKRYARPPFKIENEFFVVEALRDSSLTVLDKRTNLTFRGLNHFQDGGDCGDEYNYSPPATDRITAPRLKHATLARGPLQQTLTLELELKTPLTLAPDRKSRSKAKTIIPITTTVTLTNGVPRVDVHTTVNNTARDHRLRVHFPAPFAAATGQHDGHFEVVERKIGLPAFDETWVEQPRPEVPQRAFTAVSDSKSGLMVANRGLSEVEALKNPNGNTEITLTLLRCVGWLSRDDFSTRKSHAGPGLETPGAQMPGEWTFDYSIIPYSVGRDGIPPYHQSYNFETPLRAVGTTIHNGSLPPSGSFVKVEPATFTVSAVKRSEDGRGWLVRGYNLTGEETGVTVRPWKLFKKAERVNLAEEKQSALKPDKEGRVSFLAGGHEIVSILFLD